jgi:DNA processing protein
MVSDNTRYLLAIKSLRGIGRKSVNRVIGISQEKGISIKNAFELGVVNHLAFSDEQMAGALSFADKQIEIAISYGHAIISKLDLEFPQSLKITEDCPSILYCAGNIRLLGKDSVAIIGTREPTKHGELIAERLTNWFSLEGWIITSGLAKGIDSVAHKACIASGGLTISVLAHGLEKVYPAANKRLAGEIVEKNGLLITEYSYNSYVAKSNFVERDRIQAGLSKAVILVQSDLSGGSLHASRAALNYKRYLVVVGQSSTDILNHESKAQANELLFGHNTEEKYKLLNTNEYGLSKVLLLPNKDFLPDINCKLRNLSFFDNPEGSKDLFSS